MIALKCPNCGASYNPAKYRCEYCGSFILLSDEKEFTVPRETVIEIRREIEQTPLDSDKYPGVYVFGSLIGRGEIPL